MQLSDSQAVLFDLDGVLTDTAVVHQRAWARVFTEFLDARRASGAEIAAYVDADYYTYLDGKPRQEGVRSLLASRSIELPDGNADDGVDEQTTAGLGNRKNEMFRAILHDEGVQAFPGSVALVEWLAGRGIPSAVVSSSRNAVAVLEAAKLRDKFEFVLDGAVAATTGLEGKPAPATFLHAAAKLGSTPSRTVVVEDASSGVRAGRAGGFWVVGVDRGAGRDDLIRNGADVVVEDLAELIEG